MSGDAQHGRTVGGVTVAAAVVAILGLIIGFAGVGWDMELIDDPAGMLANADAGMLRWGYWATMFGSYLLLVPVALHLHRSLRPGREPATDLTFTAAGLYLLLGATGAGILAATLPVLTEQFAGATDQAALVSQYDLVRRIAEDGLQGVVQNVAGAVWFLGLGRLLRGIWGSVSVLSLVIGSALVLNAVGILIDVEALRLLGLTGNVLLVPAWGITVGVGLLRGRRLDVPAG